MIANRLHEDVRLGKLAENAYESYLKQKLDQLEREVFDSFLAANPDETIMELKRLSMVIRALAERIQSDIQNGRLAQKRLTEETKH